MSAARRGVATEEMKLVAKDEDVTLDWLIPKITSGDTLEFLIDCFMPQEIDKFSFLLIFDGSLDLL